MPTYNLLTFSFISPTYSYHHRNPHVEFFESQENPIGHNNSYDGGVGNITLEEILGRCKVGGNRERDHGECKGKEFCHHENRHT